MAISKNFVVKNGIEVAENLIYTQGQSVGIGTTLPDYLLSVNGNISLGGGLYVPADNPTVKTTTGIVSTTSLETITGIDTSNLLTGDYLTGTYIQSNTRITAIGSSSLSILPNHTNSSGPIETDFTFLRYKYSGESGKALVSRGNNLPPVWENPEAIYAVSSGIATTAINVIGGIASVTQLSVSGVSTLGFVTATDINVSGSVTATTFYGNLVGIATTAINVIGGIASVTQLYVNPGISTVYNLNVEGDLGVVNGTSTLGITSISGNTDSLLSINQNGTGSALKINNYKVAIKEGTFTAFPGVSEIIDSYSISTEEFTTVEYTVNFTNGDNLHAQKVLVLQNSTAAYCEEYGIIFNNFPLISVGVTNTGTTYQLYVVPYNGASGLTTYKFIRGGL